MAYIIEGRQFREPDILVLPNDRLLNSREAVSFQSPITFGGVHEDAGFGEVWFVARMEVPVGCTQFVEVVRCLGALRIW